MKKILIIEDNEDVRENTAEILELSNYRVFTAENGKAGVEIAREQKPDLILCDIMMPVLDGYGVLHLLSEDPETAGIPFIFLTAKSEMADFRKGMEYGADDYLTKPFEGAVLLQAIKVRLEKAAQLKKIFTVSSEELSALIDQANHSGKLALTSAEREVCRYKKKHVLYAVGNRAKYVYFVVKGFIKCFKTNEEGKELITKFYGAGEFLGYSSVLEGVNYKEAAIVLEDSELMLIPAGDFLTLITNDVEVAGKFIKMMTLNILDLEERLVNLAYNSLRKKVAFALVQLGEQQTNGPVLEITRKNLAAISGVAIESLIRTLSNFKDEHLIDIEPGKIIILNENKLRDLPN